MKFTLLIVISFFYSTISAQKNNHHVKVLSHADGIFYFKVSNDLKGASVTIFGQDQIQLNQQVLCSKKMIIDFYYALPGTYQIEIASNDVKRSFYYTIRAEKGSAVIEQLNVEESIISFYSSGAGQ